MSNESPASRNRTRTVVIGLVAAFVAYVAIFTAINGIPEDTSTSSTQPDGWHVVERPSTTTTETPTTTERPTPTTTAPRPSTTTTERPTTTTTERPHPTTTTTAPPAPVVEDDDYALTESDNEDIFTSTLIMDGVFLDVPDSVLVETGHAVCDAFDRGATFTDVLVIIASDPIMSARAYEVGYLTGAAIVAFCPEHTSMLP